MTLCQGETWGLGARWNGLGDSTSSLSHFPVAVEAPPNFHTQGATRPNLVAALGKQSFWDFRSGFPGDDSSALASHRAFHKDGKPDKTPSQSHS